MIPKITFAFVAAFLCFSFNACEMHPPEQTIDNHGEKVAKEEAQQKGEQPQGGNTNAPQFFPEKKSN